MEHDRKISISSKNEKNVTVFLCKKHFFCRVCNKDPLETIFPEPDFLNFGYSISVNLCGHDRKISISSTNEKT